MKRPNVFILGAPKCGTTALAEWLRQHPQVFFTPRKEPHFFNLDGRVTTTTLSEYEALFANACEHHRVVAEASTHYLYSRQAVKQILDYQPEALFIVCIRSPLEMAPSLHREHLKQGHETERSFERAWRLQTLRAAGHELPRTIRADPDRLQYGRYCKLGEQLERVFERAGRDRVLPVLLDDIRDDPGSQYRRVLTFLCLEDDGRRQFDVINPSLHTRSIPVALMARKASDLKRGLGLRRTIGILRVVTWLNSRVMKQEGLTGPLHAELIDFFRDDVNKLASLLGRDLSSWVA